MCITVCAELTYYELNYTDVLVDCISTDSPGYLLVSDSEGISYYYTQAAQLEIPGAVAFVQSLLSARRISGNVYIPYYTRLIKN